MMFSVMEFDGSGRNDRCQRIRCIRHFGKFKTHKFYFKLTDYFKFSTSQNYKFSSNECCFIYLYIENDNICRMRNGILISLCCLLLLVVPGSVAGQTGANKSPVNPTSTVRRDTATVNSLISLCWDKRLTDPQSALRYGWHAADIAHQIEFYPGEARANNNVGVVYHLMGDYYHALNYYKTALSIYRGSKDKKGEANVLSNIASVYQAQGDYPRAMEHYRKSIAAAQEAKDQQRVAIALGSIGIIYYDQGFYEKALACYLKSLSIRESMDDKQGMAYVLGNIGLIYDAQRNYPKALEYYKRSLEIRMELDDQQGIATSLINIGMIYYAQDKFDDAKEYFKQALRISDASDFKRGRAAALNNLGDVCREKKQYAEAAPYLEKALQINTEMGDQMGIANVCHSLGIVNRQTGNAELAVRYFEKSLKIAEESGLRELKMNNYRELTELYSKQGNYALAYTNQSLFIAIKDSIYNEESMTKLADLQIKYETEKKEGEIQELSRQRELQDLKIGRNYILLYMSGAVFLLILGLALALFGMSRQKQKARQITLERESELAIRESEKKYLELENMLPQIVLEMEEKERKRFAKDLHDGLGPLLSSIKIYVNELQDADTSEDEKKEMLRYVNELIDEAVNDTRTIANNLMPSIIADYGLVKALKNFCDKLQASKAVNISFSPEILHQRFDKTLEIILYRIVLELINNTIRHASAKNIEIHLFETDKELELNYKDDGTGFDVRKVMSREDRGLGLSNIQHRMQSVNGRCEFRSEPGKGMMVLIEIEKEKFNFCGNN
jgi:two-component system NarL family sensor kinase